MEENSAVTIAPIAEERYMDVESFPAEHLGLINELIDLGPPWQLAHQADERLRPRYLQRRDTALLSGDALLVAHWDDKLLALTRMVACFDQAQPAVTLPLDT